MRLADAETTWGDDGRSQGGAAGRRPGSARVKLAADVALAVLIAAVTAPLAVVAAILVKLTSRGPALYTQVRVGLGGRTYTIFKLRTMYDGCEKQSGAVWATARDPRITPLGRLLRRTHVDELPQLWNVLRGDMSLVGPRPERPVFVTKLERLIPRYGERVQVRPGITGLAQVQIAPDTDYDSVRRKLTYDLYYAENATLWLDLRLIACTALKVLHIPFALTRPLLAIPGRDAVEGREDLPAIEPDRERGLSAVPVGVEGS
jgi:lipopolysaccharide/colanic/teichoic acid biosynthesis glycosyltransferase